MLQAFFSASRVATNRTVVWIVHLCTLRGWLRRNILHNCIAKTHAVYEIKTARKDKWFFVARPLTRTVLLGVTVHRKASTPPAFWARFWTTLVQQQPHPNALELLPRLDQDNRPQEIERCSKFEKKPCNLFILIFFNFSSYCLFLFFLISVLR